MCMVVKYKIKAKSMVICNLQGFEPKKRGNLQDSEESHVFWTLDSTDAP